jgi:tetratricopeptide (TPR) repeat protein
MHTHNITYHRCLWEIYCAFSSGVPLSIGLPPSQRKAFLEGATKSMSAVMDALVKIDAENSDAFKQEDRDNIHRAIRESELGFFGLNVEVKKHLRQWYMATAVQLAEEVADNIDVKSAELLYNLASSLDDFDEHAKALEFYKRALGIYQATVGERHLNTANTYNNMAIVYEAQDEHDKALDHYERSLKIKLNRLGERNQSTATTLNNMADCYHGQGEEMKALEHYKRALKIRLAVLGEEHRDTASTYNNMAAVYKARGKPEKALKNYELALKIFRATLGEQHPSTAKTQGNIGDLLCNIPDRRAEGKALLQQCINVLTASLGADHQDLQFYNGRLWDVMYNP